MDNNDRELILGLADRLRQAHPVTRDPQAAELIAQHIARQPDSLYLLVQAVLVQEDALRTAQARIARLETAQPAPDPAFGAGPASAPAPAQPGGGGFMSRVFGQNRDAAPADAPPGRSGGGFLKTAAAAAAGVAGGALLFQGLNDVFGGGHEVAGEPHHGDGGWADQGGWDEGDQW